MIDEYKTRCQALKDQTNYVEPPKLTDRLKKKSLDAGNQIVREMNQIQESKYANSLRRDLIGISANDPNGLRQRVKLATSGSVGGGGGGEDMNQALKHHESVQEKIAEDMLALTRNLKEQTEIANRIIRKDTEVSSSTPSDRMVILIFIEIIVFFSSLILDGHEIGKSIRSELFGARQRSCNT